MRKFISHTVFNPIEKDWQPDKVLAILFHRSAATLYFVYFLWGLFAIIDNFPLVIQQQGYVVAYVFSLLIIPIAGISSLGATFFPKLARLEMYSSGSLVSLLLIYEVFVIVAIINDPTVHIASFVMTLSYIVIPIARIVFIYHTLIKQAGDK